MDPSEGNDHKTWESIWIIPEILKVIDRRNRRFVEICGAGRRELSKAKSRFLA